MKGIITKIHDRKTSINGNIFIRVEFDIDGKWAKTDLCPDYRNYQRWKPFLTVGQEVEGLVLKNPTTVNADSPI